MRTLWKRSWLGWLLLPYLGMILLLWSFVYFYSGSALKNLYIGSLSDRLRQEAAVAARLLPAGLDSDSLERLAREIGRDLGVRVTVITPAGKVLADSEHPAEAMENHGSRPEVVQALSQGSGTSIRHSTTVGRNLLYEAVLHGEGADARVLRIAVPLKDIEETLAAIHRAFLIGIYFILGVGLVLGVTFSYRLHRRIQRLSDFTREVARGPFGQKPLPGKGEDELTMLEHSLNEMSTQIQGNMREIVAQKEKLDSILRCMTEGLVAVDLRGRVFLLNENAQEMFGLPSGEAFLGSSVVELTRDPEMKRLIEDVLASDCSMEPFSREISLLDGQAFRVNAVGLRNGDENPVGYVLVFHDITELKRLETVRADFVANVSHELRTPLTAIRGYAETLLRSAPEDPSDRQQFLTIIHRHSERLGRLIDDLLLLSDLESEKTKMADEDVGIPSLIDQVLEIFQEQAEKKDVRLLRSFESAIPFVRGDRLRLQQLLINLIDNAIKYTPSGGEVMIAATRNGALDSQGTSKVVIVVADTGCGIPEKDLPRLTERFYRVDRARSRALGGTGLGLAIVKHIVEAHDGSLKIESQLAKGTTVTVSFPVANNAIN